jgi:transposase-like protein
METYLYTDGAHWYNTACKWLKLKHIVYETGMMKNLMERFIQQIKDRTQNVLMTIIFHVE